MNLSQWKIIKTSNKKLLDEFVIKQVPNSYYDKLKKFHYINYRLPPVVTNTFGLFYHDSPVLYGIVVFSAPNLELKTRSQTVLGKILSRYNQSIKYSLLNKNCLVISRIVIHPSLRGIGASPFLIENTWRKVAKRFVEITATMLYYRNFLPKSYSYFLTYTSVISPNDFLDYKSKKGAMIHRSKSTLKKYGYALFINEKIKFKF